MIDTEIYYCIFLSTAAAAHTRFPLLFFPTQKKVFIPLLREAARHGHSGS
jgi:hypothetical protein